MSNPGEAPPRTVGLLAGTLAASILLFTTVALEVARGEQVVYFDRAVSLWLHGHATGFATDLLSAVTQLGGATVLLTVTLVATAALLVRRRVAYAALMGAALAGGEVLNLALKVAFERPRPTFADPLATAAGFSFPSGHAMVALTAYGALAFIAAAGAKSRRVRVTILAAAAGLVLAIGFSRLYLGVHYGSDVLAAYGAGLAWLMLCGLALLGASRLRAGRAGVEPPVGLTRRWRRLSRSAHGFRGSFVSIALGWLPFRRARCRRIPR
jgi:membrane-associated phospholipid phosphatase